MDANPVDELVTWTAWLALYLYPAGLAAGGLGRRGVWHGRLRWGFTLGGVIFLVHVLSAFVVHYDFSHTVALAETARQTEQLTGVASGWGLWLNYLFALLWGTELVWWWSTPRGYLERPALVSVAVHGFFLFLIVNGAVVFVPWPRRTFGVTLLVLCGAAVWSRLRAANRPDAEAGG